MRILVLGGGGREHALCWKLAQEAEVICAPGNAGIAQDVECVSLSLNDFGSITRLAKEREVDLVVVGPEDPLIMGIADALRDQGIAVFGPGKLAAQLEGSKAYSKAMMQRAGVPTAEYQSFIDSDAAKAYAVSMFERGKPVVIKASGNALGKGVIVCDSVEEAIAGVDELKALGEAGKTLVIEERMTGREFSLLTLVSDGQFLSLPVAQDHKRIFDNDIGPNTGGMGTFSPIEWVSDGLIAETEDLVVKPMVQTLVDSDTQYRGVLFSGLMVTPDGVKCLEYNVRFGDPEIQSLVMRLGTGLAAALLACAKGEEIPKIEVKDGHALTVVVSSPGYPGEYPKGLPINISDLSDNVKVFHAGTMEKDGKLVTNGGRVLGVTATGNTKQEARESAYNAVKQIHFTGMHSRSDIGA